MKILFISHMYPRKGNLSYGKVIAEQAQSLNKHELIVIAPIPYTPFILTLFSKKYKYYFNIPKKDVIGNINVYYPRYIAPPGNKLFCYTGMLMYLGIKFLIKKLRKSFKFEIIHSHFTMPDGWAAAKISTKYNVPLINTIQATDLDFTINSCKKQIFYALNNCDTIITPTPRLQLKLNELTKYHSSVIGYGYDSVRLNKIIPKNRNNKIRLITISRLIKTKGIDYSIKAVKILIEKDLNLEYIIIGDGPERVRLQDLVKKLFLDDNVHFLGESKHDEAMSYLSSSDIFVLPSFRETFGLVYLEAMAFGKVVIGCKGHGFDGIIKDNKNGFLVNPQDEIDIGKKVEYIISNPLKAKAIAIGGKITSKEFTFEKIAEDLDNIYHNAIKGSKK